MNSVIEDTYFFYQHCFQSNIGDKEKRKLVELTVNYAHLSRFAALLPSIRVDNIGVERIVESKFNAIKMAIIATNLKQQAFIQSLTKMLEAQSIQIVLLKSSALNGYIYTDGHCRGNSDIDILVHPKHQKRLEEILCNVAILHDKTDSEPFDGLYEKTWISKQDPTLFLDVHTSLTNPMLFNIAITDIQKATFQHPAFNSDAIRIMSPEQNYIHMCLHAFNDGYIPHHSILDAIALYKKLNISYESIEKTSKKWGCSNVIDLMALEAEKIMTGEKKITSKKCKYTLKVGTQILRKNYPSKSPKAKLKQALLQLLIVDSILNVITTQLKYLYIKSKSLFKI